MVAGTQERAPFTVPQPNGEPIALDNDYGAVDQFKAVSGFLSKKKNGAVPPHLVGIVAESANSIGISNVELADIAKEFHAADTIVRTTPSTPIIYRLHCAEGFAVTPEEPQSGFRLVNTTKDRDYEHWQVVIDTAKQLTLEGSRWAEDNEVITEDGELAMYSPLSFLTSGYSKDVEHFINHHPDWMRYPNSHVVVGHSAVAAFLRAQAKKELTGKSGAIKHEAIPTSWAMLASAGLQRIGYTSAIGKRGDLVHETSIEGLADVVASGLGYETTIARTYSGHESMFVRRLAGVEFDARADAQTVGEKATERLFSDEDHVNRFQGLLYGDKNHVKAYLTEMAGNFMTHLLDAQ